MIPSLIAPDWPAPVAVKAFSTLRISGYSQAPFDRFNLGDHVGDYPELVQANRQLLQKTLGESLTFHWLQQVHGTQVVELTGHGTLPPADGAMTATVNQVCLVMTADCLPVLFTNKQGTKVAAAHAGWRGLCDGVLEATVAELNTAPADILVWLGPAIGPEAFQVGDEVVNAFVSHQAEAAGCFTVDANHQGKWFGDLYQLARLRLKALGIGNIFGGGECTFSDSERFFSYRRDGQTGRMATGIWIAEQSMPF